MASVFRAASDANHKVVALEFPASQGERSPFSAKGRETHSTIADTTLMSTLIAELGLELVYTEQGAAGADSRKPTSVLTTVNASLSFRRSIGTLHAPGMGKSIVGQDEDGNFLTGPSEVYTPKFAMLLAIGFLGGMSTIVSSDGKLLDHSWVDPATDDLYPIGTTVELW